MTAFIVRPGEKDWAAEHLRRYLETDGEEGYYVDFQLVGGPANTPTLILSTTGRKSGQVQSHPLIFGRSASDYVVIASKGGAPADPAWYLNLEADPICRVQVKAERLRARARTAVGAERARLWTMMAGIYPPYDVYRTRTAREIPVVVLEPLPSGDR